MRWLDRALELAAFAAVSVVAFASFAQSPGSFSTLSTTGTATLNGDLLSCSGRPWIDVRCPGMAGGAVGDDSHDDTTAILTTIHTAITNNWPVHIPAGTYKVTSEVTIDYAGQASSGFRLISEGATIDGRTISSGPVLQVECSGGTAGSPANCFYFKEEGVLSVEANTPAYGVVLGKADFSDAQNAIKIDHLVVNNASTAAAAGACQFNYVLDADVFAICDSAGGAAGIALEQTQFSRISGAGTAEATGGASIVLENGYSNSNTIFAFDMEVSPICLSITTPHDGMNTFISPYFDCTTAVNATASTHNLLINPTYAGGVANRGPQSAGVQVIGGGNYVPWQYPSLSAYTATGVDSGTVISSSNAPGAAIAVTLPAPGTVGAGWWMGFATDNGKGLSVAAPGGAKILSGNVPAASLTLGGGNYEYLQLQSDGTNFRVLTATRNTLVANGFQSRDWPGNWLFPTGSGYAATVADDGNVLSSYNTTSGLTVTLPSTTSLPTGWTIGFATDNNKSLTVQANGTAGGHILWPGGGSSATSLSLAASNAGGYEFTVLQYDGGGNFRVVHATPATLQAIGAIGATGLSHWSFPAASAYTATLTDNGNVVSSYNSPLAYMAVTLPPTTAIGMGWMVGLATDASKTMSVQVNGTSGGHILFPGSGGATSATLASGAYEFLTLQFDGSNFRVVQATPLTAATNGIAGAAAGARWSFPAVASYAVTAGDDGNNLSSFNSPSSSLSVSLPTTSAIAAGWWMGFATDAGKGLTVQVNGTSGGHILLPGPSGAVTSLSLATVFNGYEYARLEFDGANFRVAAMTPATASLNGIGITTATPSSSSAACATGAVEADASYLYFCTGPNTWKRAAWSSF